MSISPFVGDFMTVSLTVSKTLGGSALADTLAGGSSGLDLGSVTNGAYSPITLQSANTGAQDLFIRHGALADPITNVKFYIAQMSGSYGGADTAENDYTTLKGQGSSSANATANNSNGLESGLRIDMDWQVSTGSQFTPSRAQVKTFGRGGAGSDGTDLASAFDLHVDAMVKNNSGSEVDATTPVTGKIGKTGDAVLGDVAHIKKRFYLPTSAVDGGVLQWDFVIAYSFTS